MNATHPKETRIGGCLERLVRHFVENRDGVHLVGVSEYTLCGDALEGDGVGSGDEDVPRSLDTKRRTVTCPRCAMIIAMCRGVRCVPNVPAQRPPATDV